MTLYEGDREGSGVHLCQSIVSLRIKPKTFLLPLIVCNFSLDPVRSFFWHFKFKFMYRELMTISLDVKRVIYRALELVMTVLHGYFKFTSDWQLLMVARLIG